jgi:hypothetical protein
VTENLIHRKAALGGELIERNAFFRMLPEVFARSGDGAPVFFAQWLLGWFHHYFEELKNGGDLIGPQLLDQFMDVLSGLGSANGHCVLRARRFC